MTRPQVQSEQFYEIKIMIYSAGEHLVLFSWVKKGTKVYLVTILFKIAWLQKHGSTNHL